MKIAKGSIVRIEYEIRVKGGDVIESSTKGGPLEYTHGMGTLLPALEKRLEGLVAGQSLDGEIPAAEAIPPEDTLPTRVVARSALPGDGPIEVGVMFEAHLTTGGTVNLRVLAIDGDKVSVRLLPPLAGKDLVFKVRIIRIEDPVNHMVAVIRKPPPPLPAAAVKLELEDADD
jgi:FKBP-type peptidyl-prolyl cis-trans isomerase SlyD